MGHRRIPIGPIRRSQMRDRSLLLASVVQRGMSAYILGTSQPCSQPPRLSVDSFAVIYGMMNSPYIISARTVQPLRRRLFQFMIVLQWRSLTPWRAMRPRMITMVWSTLTDAYLFICRMAAELMSTLDLARGSYDTRSNPATHQVDFHPTPTWARPSTVAGSVGHPPGTRQLWSRLPRLISGPASTGYHYTMSRIP
ncbi:hypothetical protein F4779DRAFT_458873 [Xylariaceae sp. FL0662B]|nr:hypothetical protein F4779DRAFT_458873 [Xylariaceae sp. FL0662B]